MIVGGLDRANPLPRSCEWALNTSWAPTSTSAVSSSNSSTETENRGKEQGSTGKFESNSRTFQGLIKDSLTVFKDSKFILFVFVALRPKSTAMVMAGWSVHLTTLFPGQA